MATIKQVWAREILDSRGIPTVETACQLDTGHIAVYSVPGGTSTGTYEVQELRDKQSPRFKGMGVAKAVENVNSVLAPAVVGMDPLRQVEIDTKLIGLDGTDNKSNLGGNAILSVSGVIVKAAAIATGRSPYSWIAELSKAEGLNVNLKMPVPLFNMINGGLHGAGNLDFQEFLVIPASSKGFSEGLTSAVEIYMTVGENLKRRGAIHSVGDEGGYAPNLFTNADALAVFVESIKQTRYSLGRDVFLGLDVAASSFFRDGAYVIKDSQTPLDEDKIIEYYKDLNNQYKLAILEDPLSEDSWTGWKKITQLLGSQISIVGDDLIVTNPKRLEKAIKEKAANAILIKPNQIGTITETIKVVKMARDAGWRVVASHRSGETNDTFIADFAVGIGADYAKFGAPARGERVAKYNRLSSIEVEISRLSR